MAQQLSRIAHAFPLTRPPLEKLVLHSLAEAGASQPGRSWCFSAWQQDGRPRGHDGPQQPAGADRPAAGGAPQPATPPAEADAESFSPCWSTISSEDGEVTELHERLREVEEADDISPDVQRELGRILFKKKTVTEGGFKRQYVASRAETISSIKKLLQRRKDFMAARGLHDGASQPVGGRYLFTQKDRQQVMKEWQDEFHAAARQVEQQKRDSWKPQGRPVGGDWGPNTAAVRNGKHSRFARHLQLEAGSKARTSGSPLETHVAMWPCGHVAMWPCGHVRTPHFHTHPLHTPPTPLPSRGDPVVPRRRWPSSSFTPAVSTRSS